MSAVVGIVVRLLGLAGVSLSPFWAGAILSGFVALAAGDGAVVWHHKIFESGYEKALSDIAAEDAAAIARATQMRSVWRDCRAHNGQWDQSTGECQ
jgi:hypothetical protein